MYDLFITKIDDDNIINEYSIYDNEHKINIECVQHIIVEDDSIEYANNYKFINGQLVELTDEEKSNLISVLTQQPTKEELLEKQLLETQATLASLQEQILLNQTGGM